MNLMEFSDMVGKSVSQLEVSDVLDNRQKKLLTNAQAKKLIAELKSADRVWQTSVPGLKCSDFLWQ